LKTVNIHSVHQLMTQVATQLDGGRNSELRMQFSTLLLALNAGLHGFLDPDFLARVPKHQQQYFIGQVGYGRSRKTGVQAWINKVKGLPPKNTESIPTYIKDRFSSFMQPVQNIEPLIDRAGQTLSPRSKKRGREIVQTEPDDDAEGATGPVTDTV
jgi:hypothetical protein